MTPTDNTPAKRAGLVVGNQYRINDSRTETGASFDKDDIVTLDHDDGSHAPSFRRVSDGREQYVSLEHVSPLEGKAADYTFAVSVRDGTTSFSVNRPLSADEVKVIFDILTKGEQA